MHDAWHLMTSVHSSPIGLFCGSSDGFVSSIFVQTFRRAVWTPSRNDKPTGGGMKKQGARSDAPRRGVLFWSWLYFRGYFQLP